jgi:RNA-binding protein Musashi
MSATSESFKAFFAQFGPLMDSTLMLDRETGRPRGYGFVTYENDATVENLLRMDSIVMDGKMVSFSLMPIILSEAG